MLCNFPLLYISLPNFLLLQNFFLFLFLNPSLSASCLPLFPTVPHRLSLAALSFYLHLSRTLSSHRLSPSLFILSPSHSAPRAHSRRPSLPRSHPPIISLSLSRSSSSLTASLSRSLPQPSLTHSRPPPLPGNKQPQQQPLQQFHPDRCCTLLSGCCSKLR